MAVSFVAATAQLSDFIAEVYTYAPADLADDDLLLAFIGHRSALTPPAGWTLVDATASFTNGSITQTLSVYSKDAVLATDSESEIIWNQAADEAITFVYAAFRDAGALTTSDTTVDSTATYQITPPTVSGTGTGQMLVVAGSTIVVYGGSTTPTVPTSFTLDTGTTSSSALAVAHRAIGSGDSNSGSIHMAPGQTPGTNGLGAITIRIAAVGDTSTLGYVEAPTPLGAAAIQAVNNTTGARVSVPTPLGAASIVGLFDLAPYVVDVPPTRFVMDLVTPTGDVRAPISSWQATQQTGAANYLQCVIPAPGELVDTIAEATEFRISGVIRLVSGETTEYVLASAPVQTVQYARGATNYSATISGYTAAPEDVDWPESTDRTLQGVQTVYTSASGRRVRCAIDWALRPGQRAVLDGVPFVASYINYTVSADGGQSMDVGERVEGA